MQVLAASCEPVFAMTGKEALVNQIKHPSLDMIAIATNLFPGLIYLSMDFSVIAGSFLFLNCRVVLKIEQKRCQLVKSKKLATFRL